MSKKIHIPFDPSKDHGFMIKVYNQRLRRSKEEFVLFYSNELGLIGNIIF